MSSTLYKIFPSTVHTFRKPYSSLNLCIHNSVKLSVMERLTFESLLAVENFASFQIPHKRNNYRLTFIFCFCTYPMSLVNSFFDAMYQKAVPSGVLFLSVYLRLYFVIFVFQKRQTLFQTFNLLIFLFSLFFVLIKIFRNVINWTCQIFQQL